MSGGADEQLKPKSVALRASINWVYVWESSYIRIFLSLSLSRILSLSVYFLAYLFLYHVVNRVMHTYMLNKNMAGLIGNGVIATC